MPLKLFKRDREIEYNGITFISKLPKKDIVEVFDWLKKERRLIHEVNPYALEVQEPFAMLYKDQYFAIIISKNNVMIEKLEGVEE